MEWLGQMQIFLDGGKVKALLVEGRALLQNARHPGGKAGEGRKIEQELAGGQSFGQGKPDQVGVGDTVAGQAEQSIHRAGAGVDPLPPVDEGVVKPEGTLVDIREPWAQPKDADILGQLDGLGILGDVADLFLVRGFFFTVVVAPRIDPLTDKEACRGGDGHHADQPQVQPGQKGQVDRKTR